jgi:hypothetical protein
MMRGTMSVPRFFIDSIAAVGTTVIPSLLPIVPT